MNYKKLVLLVVMASVSCVQSADNTDVVSAAGERNLQLFALQQSQSQNSGAVDVSENAFLQFLNSLRDKKTKEDAKTELEQVIVDSCYTFKIKSADGDYLLSEVDNLRSLKSYHQFKKKSATLKGRTLDEESKNGENYTKLQNALGKHQYEKNEFVIPQPIMQSNGPIVNCSLAYDEGFSAQVGVQWPIIATFMEYLKKHEDKVTEAMSSLSGVLVPQAMLHWNEQGGLSYGVSVLGSCAVSDSSQEIASVNVVGTINPGGGCLQGSIDAASEQKGIHCSLSGVVSQDYVEASLSSGFEKRIDVKGAIITGKVMASLPLYTTYGVLDEYGKRMFTLDAKVKSELGPLSGSVNSGYSQNGLQVDVGGSVSYERADLSNSSISIDQMAASAAATVYDDTNSNKEPFRLDLHPEQTNLILAFTRGQLTRAHEINIDGNVKHRVIFTARRTPK